MPVVFDAPISPLVWGCFLIGFLFLRADSSGLLILLTHWLLFAYNFVILVWWEALIATLQTRDGSLTAFS